MLKRAIYGQNAEATPKNVLTVEDLIERLPWRVRLKKEKINEKKTRKEQLEKEKITKSYSEIIKKIA